MIRNLSLALSLYRKHACSLPACSDILCVSHQSNSDPSAISSGLSVSGQKISKHEKCLKKSRGGDHETKLKTEKDRSWQEIESAQQQNERDMVVYTSIGTVETCVRHLNDGRGLSLPAPKKQIYYYAQRNESGEKAQQHWKLSLYSVPSLFFLSSPPQKRDDFLTVKWVIFTVRRKFKGA